MKTKKECLGMRWFGLAIILILLFGYALLIEPFAVQVDTLNISTRDIPQGESLRIVQLSDLHMRSIGRREKKVLKAVKKLDPDYVVITGDLFKSSGDFEVKGPAFEQQLDAILQFIQQLHSLERIFVVRGNHDFGNDKEVSNRLVKKLQEHKINVLTNEKIYLQSKSFGWYLLGIDYPEFVSEQVTYFEAIQDNGNYVLESGQSLRNSYSHYFDLISPESWQNYTFKGRLRRLGHADAIGITFYSQAHRGLDAFYRLRVYKQHPTMHFSAHGTSIQGQNIDTGVRLETEKWYNFKIKVQTLADSTKMAAKVWPLHEQEPAKWQANAFDTTFLRLENGTVGAWSAKFGKHQFDEFMVTGPEDRVLLQTDFTPPLHAWVDFNYEYKALPFLSQGVPDTAFCVLLAHSPDLVKHASRNNIDLQLSGHTHGGQVCLPGWGALLSRTNLDRKYMSGLHTYEGTRIYINRGIGTANVPLRLFCPPEITLLIISNS